MSNVGPESTPSNVGPVPVSFPTAWGGIPESQYDVKCVIADTVADALYGTLMSDVTLTAGT